MLEEEKGGESLFIGREVSPFKQSPKLAKAAETVEIGCGPDLSNFQEIEGQIAAASLR